ncbi:MAG: hypothetical protein EAY76_00385 [Alphaproteobacteria bacterium]|nr:MAG: hypothetical protein EAY76_00385 [Alphaproteobacteria bacterium]
MKWGTWFRLFKICTYASLGSTSLLFIFFKPTLSAFIESMGWLMLLALLEYETTATKWKHPKMLGYCTLLSYAIIFYALYNYIREYQTLDIVNCSSWLCVCFVLAAELYWHHSRNFTQNILMYSVKSLLYSIIIVCAVLWTIEATTWLDALDAWLWILCFFAIELNMVHKNHSYNRA